MSVTNPRVRATPDNSSFYRGNTYLTVPENVRNFERTWSLKRFIHAKEPRTSPCVESQSNEQFEMSYDYIAASKPFLLLFIMYSEWFRTEKADSGKYSCGLGNMI